MDERGARLTCVCGHAFDAPGAVPGADLPCPACGNPVKAPSLLRRAGTSRKAAPLPETPSPTTPATPGTPSRKPAGEAFDPKMADLVPGYRMTKRLGFGGMGDVYLAHQASLDRQVAIKLLPPELARDAGYVRHFLKEARSAAKVSHENIVGAVDAGEAGGRFYFVMEYVAGETVFKQVRRLGRLPEARALDVARQVARGLRHAAKHGLIHRDIKPKNLMVTPEGVVKICDFGLATELRADEGAPDGEFVHTTPAYASPEQCRGETLDPRSDLYSLGVTLFEMLTGRRPFTAETSRQLMTRQVTEAPPDPRSIQPEVSEKAADLVLRMLRKKPEERFRDYDELLGAIDGILGARPGARKPWALIAVGAAAAGVLAVVLVLALGGSKPPPPPALAPAAKPPPPKPEEVESQKLLAEVRALEKAAEGKPSEFPAVLARWKELEAKQRGRALHGQFSTGLREFEARVAAEADRIADTLLRDADEALKQGRPAEAIRVLRRLPPDLARSEAGLRVAQRTLEVERLIDEAWRAGAQEAATLASGAKFDEARKRIGALRSTLSWLGDAGIEFARPAHREELEALSKRVTAEEEEAKRKAAAAAVKEPAPPAPKPPEPKPRPAVAPPSPAAAAFAALRDPERRDVAVKWFETAAPKSAVYRAILFLLSRNAPLDSPALADYLASPALHAAEAFTLAQHQELFAQLAAKIAEAGSDALQILALAHAEEIAARKGRLDPSIAMQAKLGKAAVTDTWGPPGSVAQIEMARFLLRPPGPWLARASDAAASAADFPTRWLGALCALKETAFDGAAAAERWKKLGASAPSPAWTKLCDAVSDRIRQGLACDACGAQGRHLCTGCSGAAVVACTTCAGAGFIPDVEGGKSTCTACKGRKGAVCATCNGSKGVKCGACDGKKSRTTGTGGHWRWLVELGLCDACRGTGSALPGMAWPCGSCEGRGRKLDDALSEFGALPAWVRAREGRAVHGALRWLARHQSPEGFWSQAGWRGHCREAGCPDPPPPAPSIASNFEVGLTSLSLLAFLGAGFGPDSAADLGGVRAGAAVRLAIEWLASQQKPDGLISHGVSVKPMYEHLVATYALATALSAAPVGESWTDKDRAALRERVQRALRHAALHQQKGAGWGYLVDNTASDSWVTSWGGLMYAAAREAGLEVPAPAVSSVLQWFTSVTDKTDLHVGYTPAQMGKVSLPGQEAFSHHETLSAAAGTVRLLLEGRATTPVAAAERLISRDLASAEPARRDYSYWYSGTVFLALRDQRKGADWGHWTLAATRESLAAQDALDGCLLGSWPPNDRWGVAGGRVYATAINALLLEWASGLRPLSYGRPK
jgi:serine/threonine-protein kinase